MVQKFKTLEPKDGSSPSMKICTSCQWELPLSNYSPQKTNPSKLYAWCDGCRRLNVPFIRVARFNNRDMAERAKTFRKFDDEQSKLIAAEVKAGSKVKDIAAREGCTPATVYKAVRRGS